jgi:hypothetical protein
MASKNTEFWDSRRWHGVDGEKSNRLITNRKAFLNDSAKRERAHAGDLEYAKHLLDVPFSDFMRGYERREEVPVIER